jgi:AcrR family transcriptional regulator
MLTGTWLWWVYTNGRGGAVIFFVLKAAGVSRGAFYWYFDSLDEAIEMLGRRLADEISAETHDLFSPENCDLWGLEKSGVLGAALGGEVMMRRASMDPVWARYLSNIHVLLDDSRFVEGVRRNLKAGRDAGDFQFVSLTTALDYQIGAVMGAVRRCAAETPPSRAALTEMNALTLRGLGVESARASDLAAQAARIVGQVGPGNLPWWRANA